MTEALINLSKLRGAITRIEASRQRAELLRPGMDETQKEGLDRLARDSIDMREGMDELLDNVPGMAPLFEGQLSAQVQEGLDKFQRETDGLADILNNLAQEMEEWADEQEG